MELWCLHCENHQLLGSEWIWDSQFPSVIHSIMPIVEMKRLGLKTVWQTGPKVFFSFLYVIFYSEGMFDSRFSKWQSILSHTPTNPSKSFSYLLHLDRKLCGYVLHIWRQMAKFILFLVTLLNKKGSRDEGAENFWIFFRSLLICKPIDMCRGAY